jgi:hypothetical protein
MNDSCEGRCLSRGKLLRCTRANMRSLSSIDTALTLPAKSLHELLTASATRRSVENNSSGLIGFVK